MNISGVLLRTYPENIHAVEKAITQFSGVEVHGCNKDGRMVVTVEAQAAAELSELLARMHDVPGVLSASMIYHQFEEL